VNRLGAIARQLATMAREYWVPLLFGLALVAWSFVPFGESKGGIPPGVIKQLQYGSLALAATILLAGIYLGFARDGRGGERVLRACGVLGAVSGSGV